MKQAATEVLADEDISVTLAAMVAAVYRNSQGITQEGLAEEIGVNPGALVRLLDRIAAQGSRLTALGKQHEISSY